MERYQPDLELTKAHDVRKIESCQCGGLGMRPNMIRIDGKWWHGKCALDRHGVEKIAAMPKASYSGLRWSEIGTDAMKRLINGKQ